MTVSNVSNRDDSTSFGVEEPGEAAYAHIRVATASCNKSSKSKRMDYFEKWTSSTILYNFRVILR